MDIVGVVRASDNDKRIEIEIIRKIDDSNYIKLRKLEILKEMKERKLITREKLKQIISLLS